MNIALAKNILTPMSNGVIWEKADDIKVRCNIIIKSLELEWIEKDKLHYYRSRNSKSNSYARIWGLSRIWQMALETKPAYVIEVISEKFDKLNNNKQDHVLIHELTHIPKTFSGSLTPHFKTKKRNFNNKVKSRINRYLSIIR